MFIILLLCMLVAIPLIFFILLPLFKGYEKSQVLRSGFVFASESELRNILLLREAMLQKLIYGSSILKEVENLTEEEIYHGLLAICERLEHAELPILPENVTAPKIISHKEEGYCSRDFIFSLCIFCLTIVTLVFPVLNGRATENNTTQSATTVPSDVTIPPPTILEQSGYWLPAVNQFILMPALGKVRVYYVGMFTNTFEAKGTLLQLPFPKDFYDLQILGQQSAVIEKNSAGMSPVLKIALTPGVNQISAEFYLPAPTGIAHWLPSELKSLPGVTIFMMPEQNAALRNLFQKFLDKPNIWPPRIENIPMSFRSILGQDPFADPQTKLKDPTQLSRQLVRVGEKSAEFPVFDIYGIIPDRLFLYLLIIFFAFFLFGVTAFSIFKTSK